MLRRIPLKVRATSARHINFVNNNLNLSLLFISLGDPELKSPCILEKVNVKRRANASSVCYYVFNLRKTSVLIEICITSSSIFSCGVSLRA